MMSMKFQCDNDSHIRRHHTFSTYLFNFRYTRTTILMNVVVLFMKACLVEQTNHRKRDMSERNQNVRTSRDRAKFLSQIDDLQIDRLR